MIKVKIDGSRMRARLRQATAERKLARRDAVLAASAVAVGIAVVNSPRDTNRFRNGWALAGNAVQGGRMFSVLALRKSKTGEQLERRLRYEIDWWTRIVNRYERQQRRDKWYNQAVRRLERARIEYSRFMEAGGTAIGIGLFSSLGAKRAPRAVAKVSGGTGRVVSLGEHATVIQITNREPHAVIVERRTKTFARAAAVARKSGVVQVGRAYKTRLRKV